MADQQCVLSFDGYDDYVNLGKKPEFKIDKNLTIEAWIYVSSHKPWAGIISNIFDTGTTNSGYGLLLDYSAAAVCFGVVVISTEIHYTRTAPNTINFYQWHHIAGTYDGKEAKLYVDGVEKGTAAIPGANINYNPENDLLLGRFKDDDESYFFPGKIAEVRLWNVVRSPEEIKAAMNHRLTGNEPGLVGYWPLNECSGNTITDRTGKGNNGTIISTTWQQQELPIQPAPAPEEKKPEQASKFVKVGTKGGAIAGKDFDFQPKDTASRLKKVGMMAAWAIGTFEVEYENTTSSPTETYRFGPVGSGGGQKVEVSIEPGDYLTKLTGTWGRQAPGYPKEEIITLQFETHKGIKSSVFGGGSGQSETEPFILEAPEGHEIIGFFGTHGGPQDLIVRLGIYCQPVQQPATPQPTTTDEGDPEEVVEKFVEEEKTGTAIGEIAIADISYKGKVKRTQSDEYVEIVNKGTATVDLSGWKISSGLSKRQAFTFPSGTKLEAGKSFRVYTNEVHPETGGFSFGSGSGIWSDKGDEAKLFDAQGNQVATLAYGASSIPGIKAELGVPQLTVKVSPSAINKQSAMGSKVTFVDALKLAIQSFLEDDTEIESPLAQMLNDPGAYGLPQGADKAAATKVLRSYLNQSTSTLTLQTAKSQYPPENGEKVDNNWIFLLELQEMSGLYWVIIDRSGTKAPYNYGVS